MQTSEFTVRALTETDGPSGLKTSLNVCQCWGDVMKGRVCTGLLKWEFIASGNKTTINLLCFRSQLGCHDERGVSCAAGERLLSRARTEWGIQLGAGWWHHRGGGPRWWLRCQYRQWPEHSSGALPGAGTCGLLLSQADHLSSQLVHPHGLQSISFQRLQEQAHLIHQHTYIICPLHPSLKVPTFSFPTNNRSMCPCLQLAG